MEVSVVDSKAIKWFFSYVKYYSSSLSSLTSLLELLRTVQYVDDLTAPSGTYLPF